MVTRSRPRAPRLDWHLDSTGTLTHAFEITNVSLYERIVPERDADGPKNVGAVGSHPGAPVDEALRALAEPRRRAILELVATGELAAGEIAAHFDITRPAISQHLTVLKDAGLLLERREGTRRIYRARPEGFDEVRHMIDQIWASSLDVARRLVEAEAGLDDQREVGRAS